MKYCTHCGAELLDGAAICTKCGCPIEEKYTAPTQQDSWNPLAIVGFVMSFVNTIAGLVLSIIAYKQLQRSGQQGKGLAKAGIIISAVSIGVVLIIYTLYILGYFAFLLPLLMGVGA